MSEHRVVDRRAGKDAFHLPERRTGFDRRHPGDPLSMLRDRPSVLIGLLVALNLLSAADWMLTSRALANGAVEANVVVGVLAGASPLAAPLFKAAAMLAVTALIWFSRRYRLVLATAAGAVAVYLLLMLYHISGLVSIGAL